MTKTDIKHLVEKAVFDKEELANVVEAIFKIINDSYRKGYQQGKNDPYFDN